MDLRIKNNNATKSYVITNNCTTRPRVCMKSDTGVPATPISYLPLTTSTTQGLALRAKVNDQSYRALEFRSMSGSATFYSSNANGQGLSSTTALTRASTSRTEYLTQSSTSRTEYLTRSSTSATSYLTRSSTSGESYLTKYETTKLTYASTTSQIRLSSYWGGGNYKTSRELWQNEEIGTFKTSYQYSNNQYAYTSTVTFSFHVNTVTHTRVGTLTSYYSNVLAFTVPYFSGYYYSGYMTASRSTWVDDIVQSTWSVSNQLSFSSNTNAPVSTTHGFTLSVRPGSDDINLSYTSSYSRTYGSASVYNSTTFTRGYEKLTTGTSYLTRSSTSSTVYYTRSSTYDTVYYTRSSTYSTVYHTRSSTSGYSGVSSSSSETSGWQ